MATSGDGYVVVGADDGKVRRQAQLGVLGRGETQGLGGGGGRAWAQVQRRRWTDILAHESTAA